MKKIVSFMLCIIMIISSLNFFTAFAKEDEKGTYDNYDIIIEMAKAYDRQGAQIPYDQYNSRRNIYSSPEEATAQRTIFLDCSSYVNSCYREGFGVNILPYEIKEAGTSPQTGNYDTYAKENQDAVDVLGYWESVNLTDEEKKNTVDFIYKNIQIGDIITYRHGKDGPTAGHTYIYIGNDILMHCAGADSYSVNKTTPSLSFDSGPGEIESEGTITTANLKTIFEDNSSGRYMFKVSKNDTVWSFGIIRPMARGLTPTKEALNRMKIAGLSMEKTSSVCENSSVDTSDKLTYTITLENTNLEELTGVTINDTLPSGTEFVSGDSGVTVNGNSVLWVGNVPGNTTVNVNYSVKITAQTPGTLIVSDATYVSGVKLGNITHTVSGYTKAQRALLGNTMLKFADESQKFADSIQMVKAIYKTTFNIDLFDYETPEDILDQLIDTENLTRHFSTELSKMIVPNLYGGLDIKTGWLYYESENDKTRLPKEEHLTVGDIIVADWSEGSTVYVYAGDKTLVTLENGICKALTIGDDIYTPGVNIIISLLGYNRYAVIRPSMSNKVPEIDVSSIEVQPLSENLQYYNGEEFDPSEIAVNAILSNGKKVEVTNYKASPQILTYPSDSIGIEYEGHKALADAVVLKEDKINIDVNGVKLKTDINPIIINGRTLAPVDALCESLGINTEFNSTTNTLTTKKESREIYLTMDLNTAKIDGKDISLDVPATIYKEKVLVPVRFIAENFSANVEWNGEKNTIIITGGKVMYPSMNNIDGALGFYNVIQSGDDGAGHTIYKAIDGATSSNWAVSRDNPLGAYGIFDFGFLKNIKCVQMTFVKGNVRVYSFDILVSDDGVNFTPVAENLQSSGTSLDFETFEINKRARFVKIVGHGHKTGVWNSYGEIVFIEEK